MSSQPSFPTVIGAAPRPNGSVPHPAVVSASVLGKTVRYDAGSEKAPADDAILSVALPANRQGPADVRPALAALRKEQRGRLRCIFRAGAGVLGMLILLLVFAKWVLIPIVLPMTNEAWTNAPVIVVRAENEGNAQVRLDVGQAVGQGDT